MEPLSRTGQGGFTLLELVLATTITAIALGGLFAAYSKTLDVVEDVRRGARLAQTARLILGRMDNDLAGAMTTGSGEGDGVRLTAGLGEMETDPQGSRDPNLSASQSLGVVLIDFYTASSLDFTTGYPSGRACRVQYVLRSSPGHSSVGSVAPGQAASGGQKDSGGWVFPGGGADGEWPGQLVRRERPSPQGWAEEPWNELELSADVRAIRMLAVPAGIQPQPQAAWDSRTANPMGQPLGLPAFISLELQLARDGVERSLARQVTMTTALQRP